MSRAGVRIGASSLHTRSTLILFMQSWCPSGHSRLRHGEHSRRSETVRAIASKIYALLSIAIIALERNIAHRLID